MQILLVYSPLYVTRVCRPKDAISYYIMASNTMTMLTGEKHGNVQKIKYKLAMLAKNSGDVVKAKSMLKKVIENFGKCDDKITTNILVLRH